MIVNLPPNKDVPLVMAGDPPGIIINRDLVQLVYFGEHSAFVVPGGSSIIDPLTFVQYSGEVDIFAHSGGPGFCQVDVQPNNENWSPSPAQSAASIAASGIMLDVTGQAISASVTGVAKDSSILPLAKDSSLIPLAKDASLTPLAKDTSLTPLAKDASLTPLAKDASVTGLPTGIAAAGVPAINVKSTQTAASGLAITAGTTTALTAVTGINQPAYNLHFTATAGASSTKPWYTVTLKWIDTLSGFTVQVDSFTGFMSGTSNVMSMVIAGPTDADQLQVNVTNNDTVTMTLNTAFFVVSSRTNYTTDVCYQFWTTATMPTIPAYQIGAALQVPTEKILFSLTRSVGIGVTTTPLYALPVFSGPVYIHFDGTGSNNWDVPFVEQTTGTVLHRISLSGAPAVQNNSLLFPRSPVAVQFTNNGSVSGNMNCLVVAA